MTKKYCRKCGIELIREKIIEYDMKTGQPIYLMICPTRLCNHTGIDHKYKSYFLGLYSKCKICNEYAPAYD